MNDHSSITGIPKIDRHARIVPMNGEAPTDGVRDLPTLAAASLAGAPIPPREWHVEGLIPCYQVTILNGDGGTGKSLLALQLAAATALGRQWVGCPVAAGPALFFTAEDDHEELHRRLANVARSMSADLSQLGRLTLLSLAGEDAILATQAQGSAVLSPTRLFSQLEDWVRENTPRLVVLDTLADLFGGQENDRSQARQFIQLLRGLAIRNRTSVVLLAHPSLTGLASRSGSSGSTAWSNSVRSRLYLQRVVEGGHEPDPDARLLTTMKANYSRTGGETKLRWQDGVFEVEVGQTTLDRAASSAKAERVFLSLLRAYTDEGRNVTAAKASTYAPAVFARDQRNQGVTKRSFETAMNALFAKKAIKVVEFGPPSRRRNRIEEPGE